MLFINDFSQLYLPKDPDLYQAEVEYKMEKERNDRSQVSPCFLASFKLNACPILRSLSNKKVMYHLFRR